MAVSIAKIPSRAALSWLLVAAVTGCGGGSDELKPFTSDGCSLFPSASLITHDDWCECCFQHDIAYWRGGTSAQRTAADEALRDCVRARTDDEVLARVMFEGVRFGGSPYFYNWYRWGYGWRFDRRYQPLTAVEQETADLLLDRYFELTAAATNVCRW